MRGWTIKTLLGAGMGSLIVGILVVAGISAFALMKMSDVFTEYRSTARGSLMANEIAEDLFEMRLSALKARASDAEELADEVRSNAQEVFDAKTSIDVS